MQIERTSKEEVAKKFRDIKTKLATNTELDESERMFIVFLMDNAESMFGTFWFFQKMF